MNDALLLFLGVVAAGVGGELFVRGTVGLAALSRVSPAIIAVTVAAFATSSPELSVAVSAASKGTPEISLGDVLGSNIANIALILGLAVIIQAMHVPRDSISRDLPVALGIPFLIGLLSLDGQLARGDAGILAAAFLAWLVIVVRAALHQRKRDTDVIGEHRWRHAIVSSGAGLGLLILAGHLIVSGAQGIAADLGISEFVIGATLVAIGTSTPELATTLIARLRGHDDIGLGALLGSNIFNGSVIIATAAAITPITVDPAIVGLTLGFGALAVALAYPDRSGQLRRWRGILLLALFIIYSAYVLAL